MVFDQDRSLYIVRWWPVTVLLACALAACQPASPGPEGTSGKYGTPLAAREFNNLHLPPLECSGPETCPAAVGELVTVKLQGVNFCTASLVAPDIILTASHCVPWENLAPDRSFTGNCWIRFPPGAGRAKGEARESNSLACASLISASRLGQNVSRRIYPDYAFIRLVRPQLAREPLAIRGQDVEEKKDSALLYGIRSGARSHTIEFLHCRRDDEYRLPGVEAISGEALIFPSCGVVRGFSGGPILSPLAREIIGVISGVVGFDPGSPNRPLPSVGTIVAGIPPRLAQERPRNFLIRK